MLRIAFTILLLSLSSISYAETQAVDIYTQDQLLELIRNKQYLKKVKADDCQLVQDIEARADVLNQPLYQFLWGEMLNTGTCVKANPKRGMSLLRRGAEQGSSEAMVRIAEYYYQGQYVIKDKDRAVQYAYPAAANGDLPAQMMLVKLFSEGYGSPVDYEMAYHWLYNNIFSDEKTKQQALSLLQVLETQMPVSAVTRAKQENLRTR